MSNDPSADGKEREQCEESLRDLECHREDRHDGQHQASAFEDDGHYDLQLVEWWSIKPNGDPVEEGD